MAKVFLLTLILNVLSYAANAQSPAGTWSGPFKSTGPGGIFELTSTNLAETGELTVRFEGREAKAKTADNKLDSGRLSFAAPIGGADMRVSVDIRDTKLQGTFELFENKRRTLVGAFCMAKAGTPACTDADIPPIPAIATQTQRADDSYDISVKDPAYKTNGPKVLFDEAHQNFHKTTGNFKPFAELIRNDGFVVTPNTQPFSTATLKGYKILIISNARARDGGSAFTDGEIDAVAEWVKQGGSLLFIADHAPFGTYAEKLGQRFGVDMSKGYTDDPPNRDPVAKDLLFSRDNKLLADHAITRGRNASEKIGRVVSFTGQSLRSANGTPILKLADTAYDEYPNSDKKPSAAGRAQAIAMKFGKGRVFVSGEAAMFTAQLTPDDRKVGMNVAGLDNRQYALNVMHWLSGLLK